MTLKMFFVEKIETRPDIIIMTKPILDSVSFLKPKTENNHS